ncbi:retroelement silencing factor 1 isoform X3 [Dipodomys merriami]|uniref:retroelement silencing factor 1 isoform X3 n=1 Tax=Dipodomys merriami TaxID=94247 RepID=UPI00384EB0DF
MTSRQLRALAGAGRAGSPGEAKRAAGERRARSPELSRKLSGNGFRESNSFDQSQHPLLFVEVFGEHTEQIKSKKSFKVDADLEVTVLLPLPPGKAAAPHLLSCCHQTATYAWGIVRAFQMVKTTTLQEIAFLSELLTNLCTT